MVSTLQQNFATFNRLAYDDKALLSTGNAHGTPDIISRIKEKNLDTQLLINSDTDMVTRQRSPSLLSILSKKLSMHEIQ